MAVTGDKAGTSVMSVPASRNIAGVAVPDGLDDRHIAVALSLADGKGQRAAAKAGGVDKSTVSRWMAGPAFRDFVGALALRTGLALRSERVLYAKRLLDKLEDKPVNVQLRKSDAIGVLRYVREELVGVEPAAMPAGAAAAQSVIIGTQIIVQGDVTSPVSEVADVVEGEVKDVTEEE